MYNAPHHLTNQEEQKMDRIFVLVLVTMIEVEKNGVLCISHISESLVSSDDIDKVKNQADHQTWHKNCADVWVTEVVGEHFYRIDEIKKI